MTWKLSFFQTWEKLHVNLYFDPHSLPHMRDTEEQLRLTQCLCTCPRFPYKESEAAHDSGLYFAKRKGSPSVFPQGVPNTRTHATLSAHTQFPPLWIPVLLLSSMNIRDKHLLQEAVPDSVLSSSGDGQVLPRAQFPFITTDLGNAHTRAGQRWADLWAGDHGQVCAAH